MSSTEPTPPEATDHPDPWDPTLPAPSPSLPLPTDTESVLARLEKAAANLTLQIASGIATLHDHLEELGERLEEKATGEAPANVVQHE